MAASLFDYSSERLSSIDARQLVRIHGHLIQYRAGADEQFGRGE